MKLLHYIPTYAPAWKWGGPVRSVSGLCEQLARSGHEVTVFTTDAGLAPADRPPTEDAVQRNGVSVHYFRSREGRGILSPGLESAVRARTREFDLVHVTAIWQRTGPAACRAARRAGVPYVISPRGALGPYSWSRGRWKKLAYYWLVERENLRRAAGFHYTAAAEADECRAFRFGQPFCVAANGVDFGLWRRDAAGAGAWRRQTGIPSDAVVLLYAGRLHHKKGLDLLPEVLAGVVRRCPERIIRLVLLGPDDDGTAEQVVRGCRQQGVADSLLILPATTPAELPAVYSAADVFVFPSHHENFGNVAVEAAACGAWVLASEETAVAAELAELGAGARLARAAEVWIEAISARLGHVEGWRETIPKLVDRYAAERTTRRIESLYRDLLVRAAGAAAAAK